MYGRRKEWDAVHSLHKDDLTSEHRKQLIDEAIEDNGEEYVVDCILHHCSEAEVDNVIGTFLSRGLWQALASMLQENYLNDKQRAEVIEGAANIADDLNFYKWIVPNSPSVKKQPSLEWYVRSGCWVALGRILKREYISKDQRNYVVCKAAELADEKSFRAIALPVCTRDGVRSSILHHCSEAEVDNVIGTFLSRGMWQALANMLQWRSLNDKQRAEVIEGAANLADDLNFYKRIVPNSPSLEKQPSVEWLIRNGCWEALGRLLEREFIAKDQLNGVVGKAAELADEKSFLAIALPVCTRDGGRSSILHHCFDAEVDTVIGTFLSRGMWQALASMLQWRNLNDKQRAEVIEGSANLADDLDFYERIVPNSQSVEKQVSAEWLIRNGCRSALRRLRNRKYIAKDQRNAELADEKTSFLAIVLPFCTRKQEKSSILHFVQESRWSMIDCLKIELPNEIFCYMVSWAAEHADTGSLTKWILPKCDRDQKKQAAARLIKETRSFELIEWFKKISNVDERQDIFEIALTQGKEETFDDQFFSACSVSELYYLVVQLAMKGWNVPLCHLIYNVERRKDFERNYWDAKGQGLFTALYNNAPPNVSAESPMKWAIQLGQPVVMRLLYESGCPSNAVLHTLCIEIEADTPAQDKPKLLSFLQKVATTPRSLKSLCRLAVSRCLTEQESVCHKDVETLPLPESLKKYMMFSTETDPEDCKLWLNENDCYSNYVWALSHSPQYDLDEVFSEYDVYDDVDFYADYDDYEDYEDYNHNDDYDYNDCDDYGDFCDVDCYECLCLFQHA